MTVVNEASAFTKSVLGAMVRRPTAVVITNSTNALFTVSGGLVAVTQLIGVVTTAIANNAVTIKAVHTPSGGSAGDLSAATTIQADAAGTIYTLTTGDESDLLSARIAGGSEVPTVTFGQGLHRAVILPAGSLGITVSNHDPGTGAIKWYLTYVPLDDGASVAVA